MSDINETAKPASAGRLEMPDTGHVRARTASPGPPSKPITASPRGTDSGNSPAPASPPPSRPRNLQGALTPREETSSASSVKARMVVQQIDKASYLAAEGRRAQAGRGYIIYVTFMKLCDEAIVRNMVEVLFNCNNLENTPESSRVPIRDFESDSVDLLIIPQASLAGRLKGSTMQFHSLAAKTDGQHFFETLKNEAETKGRQIAGKKVSVFAGSWGCRQETEVHSSGPNTLLFEF